MGTCALLGVSIVVQALVSQHASPKQHSLLLLGERLQGAPPLWPAGNLEGVAEQAVVEQHQRLVQHEAWEGDRWDERTRRAEGRHSTK